MTTPDEAQALFPVTQEDREAAATWFITYAGETLEAQCMREGTADHWPLVQAFARHRISHSLPGDVGTAIEEAQFLCDRLDELDWSMGFDDFGNNYNGHVDPSHSRLKGFLAALTPSALSERPPWCETCHESLCEIACTKCGKRWTGTDLNDGDSPNVEPVAWLYEKKGKQSVKFIRELWLTLPDRGWTETPLYDRPVPSALSDDAGEGE